MRRSILFKIFGPVINDLGWILAIYGWWVLFPADNLLAMVGCVGIVLGTTLTAITTINGNGENKK
jgi:xanthosine utilization system XapX-like protein